MNLEQDKYNIKFLCVWELAVNRTRQPFKRKDCARIVDAKTTVSKYLSSFGLVVATGGAGADIFLRGGAEYDLETWILLSLYNCVLVSFSIRWS